MSTPVSASKVLTAAELSSVMQKPALEALVVPTADELLRLTEQAILDAEITPALNAAEKQALRDALIHRLGGTLTGNSA